MIRYILMAAMCLSLVQSTAVAEDIPVNTTRSFPLTVETDFGERTLQVSYGVDVAMAKAIVVPSLVVGAWVDEHGNDITSPQRRIVLPENADYVRLYVYDVLRDETLLRQLTTAIKARESGVQSVESATTTSITWQLWANGDVVAGAEYAQGSGSIRVDVRPATVRRRLHNALAEDVILDVTVKFKVLHEVARLSALLTSFASTVATINRRLHTESRPGGVVVNSIESAGGNVDQTDNLRTFLNDVQTETISKMSFDSRYESTFVNAIAESFVEYVFKASVDHIDEDDYVRKHLTFFFEDQLPASVTISTLTEISKFTTEHLKKTASDLLETYRHRRGSLEIYGDASGSGNLLGVIEVGGSASMDFKDKWDEQESRNQLNERAYDHLKETSLSAAGKITTLSGISYSRNGSIDGVQTWKRTITVAEFTSGEGSIRQLLKPKKRGVAIHLAYMRKRLSVRQRELVDRLRWEASSEVESRRAWQVVVNEEIPRSKGGMELLVERAMWLSERVPEVAAHLLPVVTAWNGAISGYPSQADSIRDQSNDDQRRRVAREWLRAEQRRVEVWGAKLVSLGASSVNRVLLRVIEGSMTKESAAAELGLLPIDVDNLKKTFLHGGAAEVSRALGGNSTDERAYLRGVAEEQGRLAKHFRQVAEAREADVKELRRQLRESRGDTPARDGGDGR